MIKSQHFEPEKLDKRLHIGYLVTEYDNGEVKRTRCSYEKISTIIPDIPIVNKT